MESNQGGGFLPINDADLTERVNHASMLLRNVSWHPKVKKERVKTETAQDIIKSISNTSSAEKISITDVAKKLSNDQILIYSPDIAYCLEVVRKGITLGMHSANLYSKASNFYTLQEQSKQAGGIKDPAVQTEFREKNSTTSAIMMFVTASYIVSKLSNYKTNELDSIRINFEGIPEDLHLVNFVHAMNYMVYYYGFFESSSMVKTDLEFVKMTLLYFEDILNEIDFLKDSLKYTDPFTSKSYKLEDDDFTINGFESHISSSVSSVSFNRVSWDDIVGNTLYKHSSRRTIQFMMCYDPERQMNPVNELGGFPGITMEYGPAGTGKGMGIGATATELSDRCKDLGIKFLYHPIPQTIIDTYQGGSARNMAKWFNPLNDPSMIIYGPIDDADGKLRDRGAKGNSAGVIETVEVFLTETEGASASKRGNRVIQIYTNLPETLDKAVLSRVQKRSLLEGAITTEDFLDQDYLWWRAYEEMVPGFINMDNPMGYEYMSAQDIAKVISDKLAEYSESKVYKIQQIIDGTLHNHKITEQMFFGKLYKSVKKEFPLFTSRDVRNIQSAVNTRLTDFDFPDEWMNDHALFYSLDYDKKLNMLRELMKSNMGKLSFAEIRFQEVVKYLDNMAMIGDADFESKVAETIDRHKVDIEAKRRLDAMLKKSWFSFF